MPVGNAAESSPTEKNFVREEPDSLLKDDEPVGNGKATKAENADQLADLADSPKSRFISWALCISFSSVFAFWCWSLTNFALLYCYTEV